jgi:hypothetical protein
MKEGTITSHEVERILAAVEHDMDVEVLDENRIAISDNDTDSDSTHIVNLSMLTCSCPDYEYRCNEDQYCKHIFRAIFVELGML